MAEQSMLVDEDSKLTAEKVVKGITFLLGVPQSAHTVSITGRVYYTYG